MCFYDLDEQKYYILLLLRNKKGGSNMKVRRITANYYDSKEERDNIKISAKSLTALLCRGGHVSVLGQEDTLWVSEKRKTICWIILNGEEI